MNPLRRRLAAAVVFGVVLAGSNAAAAAEAPPIHDGLTADQLAAFAVRQGLRAEVGGSGRYVTIYAGDPETLVPIVMTDCDPDGACRGGLIQNISCYFVQPDGACSFWHWNLEAHGATGFGPDYVTLQRYLQFRGVTDQYLPDAIDSWLSAAPSFWALVEECHGN
jgi:hypothetical protein